MTSKWLLTKLFFAIVIVVTTLSRSNAQSYLKRNIEFDTAGKYTLSSILDSIETQGNVTLSYNSRLFDKSDSLVITYDSYQLSKLILLLGNHYDFESTYKRSKKILLYRDTVIEVQPTTHKYYGYLKDSESKSPIPNGFVYHSESSAYTDENGYFELSLDPQSNEVVVVGAVGYQTDTLSYQSSVPVIIALQHINILDTFFVIGNKTEYLNKNLPPSGKVIDLTSIDSYSSLTGEADIVTSIRHYSSFDPGGEGRHGLSIRGGSSDQNLILLDDIPVFEFTHIGGYRSIFLSNLVQTTSFQTSGVTANYGGKLSSVLDVRLKSPNLTERDYTFNVGLDAISATANLPIIKDKVGVIIGGRTRFLKFIDQPIIENLLNYSSVDLDYNDLFAKLVYQITPEHQLSALYYKGNDLFNFEKEGIEAQRQRIFNSIGWGNTLYGVNYRGVLSKRFSLQAHLSKSEYFFESRGSYSASPSVSSLSYDVFSSSQNSVLTGKSVLKYYHKKLHQSSIGVELSSYQLSPNLFQSNIYRDEDITNNVLAKELFQQDELVLYTQHKLVLNERTTLSAGLRYLRLPFDTTTFSAWEPRVSLHHTNGNLQAKLDYTVIHQPMHVLINPGIGLPADLWHPSTDAISPQRADQISASLDFVLDEGQTLGFSIYNKSFTNLIEYVDPNDLLYNILNPNDIQQVGVTRLNIQEAILQGDGNARGGEASYRYQSKRIIGWLNYGITYSTRQFDEINGGDPFPSRFDRRHSISTGVSYKLNARQTLTAQWVYGSGTPITLDIEQTATQVIPGDRNNSRTLDFHHLDLRYAYRKSYQRFDAEISAGIYNIYNRKNTFYIYLRDVPNENRKEAVNVSLFPILPSIKANILF